MQKNADASIGIQPAAQINAASSSLPKEGGIRDILFGAFTGITLLVVVLNLTFHVWLRQRTTLYCAAYVILTWWTLLLVDGFIAQVWPNLTTANSVVPGVSILMAYGGHIAFLTHIYRLRDYLPRLRKAALAVAALCVFAALSTFFVEWRIVGAPMQSLFVFSQCVALAVSVALFRHRPHLRFYVIAFLPIQLHVLATVARNLGLVSPHLFIANGATLAAATHIILLTIALARRAQDMESENKQVQNHALALSRQSERHLESRVAARTAELSQANASLEREVAMRQILQVELQQALSSERTAHAAQKEFVSMVSHEFRNPLAVIDTVAQRMEETLTERHPDLVASAGRMRRSVARLLALIENCLTEDRLSSPYMLPRVTPTDLTLLLKNHFGDKGRGARVHLDLPDSPITLPMDANLIGTAISNLVENALKYSPAHQPVEVRLRAENGHAEVRVTDHGAGIPVDDQPRIFEKFYRAANAQTQSGAGLGLYLARELAQRHGGDVQLQYSTAEGGTALLLTLPLPMQATMHSANTRA